MRSGHYWLAAILVGVGLMAWAAHPLAGGQAGGTGQAAYDRVCAECHGPQGRGKGGADDAPGIIPMNKDFESLLALVREGGCKMPSIPSSKVSDAEVGQILSYLKSVGGSAAEPVRAHAAGC